MERDDRWQNGVSDWGGVVTWLYVILVAVLVGALLVGSWYGFFQAIGYSR